MRMSFTKGKRLLAASALLLVTSLFSSASAAQTDVTAMYLKNASFENDDVSTLSSAGAGKYNVTAPKNWSVVNNATPNGNYRSILVNANAQATDNNFGRPGTPSDGTYAYYVRHAHQTMTTTVSQQVTLPAGNYTVSVDSKAGSGKSDNFSLALFAEETSQALPIVNHLASYKQEVFVENWTTSSVSFTLTEQKTINLGVRINFANDGNQTLLVLLDNFRLTAESTTSVTGQAVAEGDNLYLYNVGTGKYVNFNGLWSTYYTLSEAGMPLSFQKVDGQDAYIIKTIFADETMNHFYSYNNNTGYAFSDGKDKGTGEYWIFESAGTNTYYIRNYLTGFYLTGNTDNKGGLTCSADNLASTENTTWKIVSKSELDEKLAEASGANPVNATHLIKDANLIWNSTDNNSWSLTNASYTETSNGTQKQYRVAEIFASIGKFSQTVTFPKAGTYELSASAFQRTSAVSAAAAAYQAGNEPRFAVLYAGDRATYVQSIFDEAGSNGEVGVTSDLGYIPNSKEQAGNYFWNETLYRGNDNKVLFYVSEDNAQVEIGVKTLNNAASSWTAFDNFRLTYLGSEDLTNATVAATPNVTAGGVYIYNTKLGKYVNQGEYAGTSGVVETEGGVDFTMAAGTDGGYTFESKIGLPEDFNTTREITGNYYLYNNNGKIYTDGDGSTDIVNNFKFQSTDKDNVYYIYTEVDGVKQYVTVGDGKSMTATPIFIVNDDANQWKLQTKADRVANLNEAFAGNGVDATFYIEDPDFAVANSRIKAWNIDGQVRTYGEWWSRDHDSKYFSPYTAWLNDCRSYKVPDSWFGRDVNNIKKYAYPAMNRTDFGVVSQQLTGLKNGVYVLSCQGFYCDGHPGHTKPGDSPDGAYKEYWNNNTYVRRTFLFANDTRLALKSVMEDSFGEGAIVVDNDFDDYLCGAEFYNDKYPNQIPVIVTDGKLTIGIAKDSRRVEDFAAFDKFRLTYYGAATDVNALKAAFDAAYQNTVNINDVIAPHSDATTEEKNQLSSFVNEFATAPTEVETLTTAIENLNDFNQKYDEAVIAYDIYKILKSEYDNDYYTQEKWPYASTVKRAAMVEAFETTTPQSLEQSVNAINDLRLYVESNAKAERISEEKAGDPDFETEYSIESRNFTKPENIVNPDFSDGLNGWTQSKNGSTGGDVNYTNDLRRAQFFPRYADAEEKTIDNFKTNYLGYSGLPLNLTTTQQVKGLKAGQYIVTVSLAPTGNTRVKATVESKIGDKVVNRSVSSLPITESNGGAYTNGWYDTWFVANITNSEEVVTLSYQAIGGTQWAWASTGVANVRVYRIDQPQEFYLDEDKEDLAYLPEHGKTNAKCVLHRSVDVDKWNSLILPIDLDYEQFVDAFGEGAKLAKIKGLDETHLTEGIHSLIVFEEVELGTNLPAVQAGTHYILKPTKAAPFMEGTYTLSDETTTIPAPYYLIDNVSIEARNSLNVIDTLFTTTSAPTEHIYYNGQYVKANIPAKSYAFAKGDLYHIASELPMKGFRCWIEESADPTVKSNLSFRIEGLDESEATVIDGVEISDNPTNGDDNRVYNVSGQYVGTGADTFNALPKGVYLVNGKKVVVK